MTPRGLRIALIASLMANLFVGSAMVAGGIMWQRARAASAGGVIAVQTTGRLKRAAAALPDDHRRALRRILRTTDAAALAEAQAARADAARLLAAPNYDAAALAAAFARARQADLVLRTGVERRLADFAATLPPDERATLAGAMIQHGRRPRRDRK